MYFHHLHFYVRDVAFWRDWFIHRLAFSSAAQASVAEPLHTVVVRQGSIEIRLSSERVPYVQDYLQRHPEGLVDVGFATDRFDQVLRRSRQQGAQCRCPVILNAAGQRQCQLQGWGDLRHTLIEVSPQWVRSQTANPPATANPAKQPWLAAIDHVVLNVPQGELSAATDWYRRVFGLENGQTFDINTAHSGLHSQVLVHPQGTLQLPVNEPTSPNSQVQEFLHHNRGAGVQHVALRGPDAVGAIAYFRQQGLQLIDVPATYYDGLQRRIDCPISDISAASRQQLLLDWAKGGQQGMLLQTFTKPIFAEPTFFFEIIERSLYFEKNQVKVAQGFGEGNFQALFEAIERAQISRGTLT
ncbi:MAG: 4-hydroxyphenylpyruvate dioxygenase [Phormidesmis sp.]